MSSQYIWADAKNVNYVLVDREHAPDELDTAPRSSETPA